MVEKYKTVIYVVCYMFSDCREEVEDLFQDVLIRLWKGYDKFRGEADVKTWIYRVSLNCCINRRKKIRRSGTHVPLSVDSDFFDDIDDSYTGAWFYFISDDVDESHALGAGETVDLWDYDYTSTSENFNINYDLCLVLGNGTGTFAHQCAAYFPGVQVEGVEIDDKITDLAYEYFDMSPEVKVTTYDGRAYLQTVDTTYDVIQVDAYQDITIPFQMSSVEFFTMVKEHLDEGGVMVVNMNMHSSEEGNINDHLADTIASVFPCVYTVDVPGTTNRELFAGSSPDMLTKAEEHIAQLKDEELGEMLEEAYGNLAAYEKGPYLLTDDKAPVELLGMQVIDSLIQNEIGYYKEIFREEGIEGLLNSF